MTTNAEWLDAVQALSPTGITRVYAQRPDSLTTADLPAAWPMLPVVDRGEPITTCVDLSKVRTLGYMVAHNPIGQDIPAENLEALATLVDNLETAFDAIDEMEFIEYRIETTAEIEVAGVNYYGLSCELTGRNA